MKGEKRVNEQEKDFWKTRSRVATMYWKYWNVLECTWKKFVLENILEKCNFCTGKTCVLEKWLQKRQMYWNVLENWGICSEFFFILDIPPHLICLMPVDFIIHALPFLIYIRILPYTPNSFTMSWWWNSWFVFLGISFANVFFPVCQSGSRTRNLWVFEGTSYFSKKARGPPYFEGT